MTPELVQAIRLLKTLLATPSFPRSCAGMTECCFAAVLQHCSGRILALFAKGCGMTKVDAGTNKFNNFQQIQ